MLKCPNCDSLIPENVEKCFTCGFNAGPPNVRTANSQSEAQALAERYKQTLERAETVGSLAFLRRFEEVVKSSCAVINCNLRFLFLFVTSSQTVYANYEGGVAGHVRKPADFYDDLKRRGVGGTLFGGYAGEIIYAALSRDGSGPTSYGPYSLRLRDVAVMGRATVLENNSYEFVRKHHLEAGNPRPLGYMASWSNRHLLAVAKLGDYITPQTTEAEFQKLLLTSTGDRATDELIEVHLYGTFDLNAVESVKGSSRLSSRDDRDLLRMVKTHLNSAGKPWIEE